MGRARKVPLSTILPVKELAVREPLDSGSKAKANVLEALIKEQRKAISSGTNLDRFGIALKFGFISSKLYSSINQKIANRCI